MAAGTRLRDELTFKIFSQAAFLQGHAAFSFMSHTVPEPKMARDPAATRRSPRGVSVRVRPGTPSFIGSRRPPGVKAVLKTVGVVMSAQGSNPSASANFHSEVAQLAERRPEEAGVGGSNPSLGAISRNSDGTVTCLFAKQRPSLTGCSGSSPGCSANLCIGNQLDKGVACKTTALPISLWGFESLPVHHFLLPR